jgi:hypothetical protein
MLGREEGGAGGMAALSDADESAARSAGVDEGAATGIAEDETLVGSTHFVMMRR